MVLFTGATLIDTSQSSTVKLVEPSTEPIVAEILAMPWPTLVAIPWDPAVLLIVATVDDEETQATDVVTFAADPSVYSPVAVNCCELPTGTVGLCGLISMAARMPLVTIKFPEPVTPPELALMSVLPPPILVANPPLPGVLLTVATLGTDELQCAEFVTSWVEPSVNVPMAVNVWFTPNGMAAFAGLTPIETTIAGVTVSVVDPLTPPRVAVIVTVPVAIEVPSALELTVPTAVLLEFQVEEAVRSWVLPSVKTPVALNCWVVPSAMDGPGGFTVIETKAATLTVRVVEPEIELDVAEMLDVPLATLVAKPCTPGALPTVATEGLDEAHCTEPVMFWVLPSVKVPIAENWSVVPKGIVGSAGVMEMDTKVAAVTLKVDEPAIPAAAALTLAWPVLTLVASPLPLTVATDDADEVHITDVVRSRVLPSA
jgi:hypothetical protein